MSEDGPYDDFYLRIFIVVNREASIKYTFDDLTIDRRILYRKWFGSHKDVIIKAIIDIKASIVNKLVSIVCNYKVSNDNVQEPKLKDKWFSLSKKATFVDSNEGDVNVEQLDQEITLLGF